MSLQEQIASLHLGEAQAGPSKTARSPRTTNVTLTPRQKEKTVSPQDISLDAAHIDTEIALLISQYLESKSHSNIARLLDEELTGQLQLETVRQEDVDNVENAILDGDYGSLEGLLSRPGLLRPQTQRAFLYMCYRQQFLEHVENRESQKAFNLLSKRLKPLEHYQPVPYDFYNLSYLTSASTVHDAPSFRDWAGVGPERDRLVEMWRELTESERRGQGVDKTFVPPDRLITLLRQAVAWQIEHSSGSSGGYAVTSLLMDHQSFAIPNQLALVVKAHKANIKCVDWINRDLAISGSSDTTLQIFSTADGSVLHTLKGHTSRIWDVATSSAGRIVSASGDGSVRIWGVDGVCSGVLEADSGDVYSARWRPDREDQVVSAGYDKILRMWDVETAKQIRTFSGHSQSTLAVDFDPSGNLIASGSKDKHIRLWDAVGGVCVHTIPACLGEITSVAFDHEGKYLLAGCKDNSNRLWDLRMQRNLYRYTGHQNTSKNLIRANFAGPNSQLIVSGSEDGQIYLWERESTSSSHSPPSSNTSVLHPNVVDLSVGVQSHPKTGGSGVNPSRSTIGKAVSGGGGATTVRPLMVLDGCEGPVYDVKWSEGGMISGGEDGGVGVWRVG